jgi:ribosomal protein L11 methyltransferase
VSYYELTVNTPASLKDALMQKFSEAGCLGAIEHDDALVAYFPDFLDIDAVTTQLSLLNDILEKAGRERDVTFRCQLIPEQDWNESWKKDFRPVDAGERFTILPAWEEKKEGRINIVIDPAMAFGTGHHETTRSCLVLMEKCEGKRKKDAFLDLGTGTGILAIAASKLGYRSVVAVDTDPLATDAARMNVSINEVPDVVVREGSLPETGETYDVIAANLISGVLVRLAGGISARLNPGGVAILSGILADQETEVIEAMEQAGLLLAEKYRDGQWTSLLVEKTMS